jgi:hypothetical protein
MKTLSQLILEIKNYEGQVSKHFKVMHEPTSLASENALKQYHHTQAETLFNRNPEPSNLFHTIKSTETALIPDENGVHKPGERVVHNIDPDRYFKLDRGDIHAYIPKAAMTTPIAKQSSEDRKLFYYHPESQSIKHYDLDEDQIRGMKGQYQWEKNNYPELQSKTNFSHTKIGVVEPHELEDQPNITHAAEKGLGNKLNENLPVIKLHNKLVEHYPLSEHHANVLRNYTLESSDYNNDIIHNVGRKYSGDIKNITDTINELGQKGLPHQLHVFSGTGDWNPLHHVDKKLEMLRTPAFTSTSINPHIALDFTSAKSNKGIILPEKHILHFVLPKGYRNGAYISHASQLPKEREYLLNKNQFWNYEGNHINNTLRYDKQPVRIHTLTPFEL